MTILKNIKLTNREAKVLSIIKSHGTPITSTELHQITKIDKRTIMEIVARLRFKGVPIVSKRFGTNSGYSIAKDENERMRCVAMLSNQATTMMKNINGLANADLKNWDKYIKVM